MVFLLLQSEKKDKQPIMLNMWFLMSMQKHVSVLKKTGNTRDCTVSWQEAAKKRWIKRKVAEKSAACSPTVLYAKHFKLGRMPTNHSSLTATPRNYGDSTWADLLTNINGTSISYDKIGNPLNWTNGRTLTWTRGRNLNSVSNGTNTFTKGGV